jgi:hypothetical protein
MSARWTVYLHETAKGWEWGRAPNKMGWGYYKTSGHAKSAAKRSINPVYGGKTKAKDFEFVVVTEEK